MNVHLKYDKWMLCNTADCHIFDANKNMQDKWLSNRRDHNSTLWMCAVLLQLNPFKIESCWCVSAHSFIHDRNYVYHLNLNYNISGYYPLFWNGRYFWIITFRVWVGFGSLAESIISGWFLKFQEVILNCKR